MGWPDCRPPPSQPLQVLILLPHPKTGVTPAQLPKTGVTPAQPPHHTPLCSASQLGPLLCALLPGAGQRGGSTWPADAQGGTGGGDLSLVPPSRTGTIVPRVALPPPVTLQSLPPPSGEPCALPTPGASLPWAAPRKPPWCPLHPQLGTSSQHGRVWVGRGLKHHPVQTPRRRMPAVRAQSQPT